MSYINPATALDILHKSDHITWEERRTLAEQSPLATNEAMKIIESDPAFLDALSALADEIKRRVDEQNEETERLLKDPRYAEAPEVKGVFVREHWDAGDYLTEVGRDEFTVPLPYLVANREFLDEVRNYGDADWLASDLGLNADHDGPFDVDDIEESISAWLSATEGSALP